MEVTEEVRHMDNCPTCTAVTAALDKHGVEYEVVTDTAE